MKPVLLLALAVLLSACVSAIPPRSEQAREQLWLTHASRMQQRNVWDLRGRLAVQADERGWQASVQWRRDREHHRIQLSGPIGGGAVLLEQDSDGASLTERGGQKHHNRDIEALMAAVTGWSLPLNGLAYWVRGIPAPDAESATELDNEGTLATLRQQDWHIRYLEYGDFNGQRMPTKIFLRREDGGLEVRLVLNNWQAAASSQ